MEGVNLLIKVIKTALSTAMKAQVTKDNKKVSTVAE